MKGISPVVITGVGIEFPGLTETAHLLDALASPVKRDEFDPIAKLGRTGLRYKDRSTKLALCAGQTALADAGLPVSATAQISPESFGVVASSNLGNLDTVCQVLETIRSEGADATSPLNIPNLSSNVVASSLAIRFGCRGLNLMLCNGATSGTDALYFAWNAIRARRADRVLVVGVETSNPIVDKLMTESAVAWLDGAEKVRLGDGGAAIVLETTEAAREHNAHIYGELRGYGYSAGSNLTGSLVAACRSTAIQSQLWVTPSCSYSMTKRAVRETLDLWKEPPVCIDLSISLGETYGALGVFQCIVACLWMHRHGGGSAIATSGACWGSRAASILIHRSDRQA